MSETKKVSVITLNRPAKDGKSQEPITLTMRALEDVQYDEIDAWLRNEYMMAVRKSLRADTSVTPQERTAELEIAQRTAVGLSFLTGEGARQMSTPKGLTKLIYEHCEAIPVSEDELRKLMFDVDNVNQVNKALMEVNLDPEEAARILEDAKSPGKKQKRKRRKKLRSRARKQKG